MKGNAVLRLLAAILAGMLCLWACAGALATGQYTPTATAADVVVGEQSQTAPEAANTQGGATQVVEVTGEGEILVTWDPQPVVGAAELAVQKIQITPTHDTATVIFTFTSSVEANWAANQLLFYAQDARENNLAHSQPQLWPLVGETPDTVPQPGGRCQVQMQITGMLANTGYVVGVREGVQGDDGEQMTIPVEASFNTQPAPTPLPTATPTPTLEPTPTPAATQAPVATPLPTQATVTSNTTAAPISTAAPVTTAVVLPTLTPVGTAIQPPVMPLATATPLWFLPETSGTLPTASAPLGTLVDGNATAPPQTDATGQDDPGPLVLESCEPGNGATDVDLSAVFALKFSKNVVAANVRHQNAAALSLWKDDQQVPIDVYMVDDTQDYNNRGYITVQPQQLLEEKSMYVLRVSDTLASQDGETMGAYVELRFYTLGYQFFPLWGIAAIASGGAMIIASVVAVFVLRRKRQEPQPEGDDGDEEIMLLPPGQEGQEEVLPGMLGQPDLETGGILVYDSKSEALPEKLGAEFSSMDNTLARETGADISPMDDAHVTRQFPPLRDAQSTSVSSRPSPSTS